MGQTITVTIGEFALGALAGEAQDANISQRLAQAVRYYLADRAAAPAGWAYPNFLRPEEGGSAKEVPLTVDPDVWKKFAEEAKRQDVSTDELLQHAVLYLAADRDAGRLTQRILDDLERGPF